MSQQPPTSAWYDVGDYGFADYGVVIADPVQGSGGGIDVWYELHRATIDNVPVEDLSDLLTGGGVDLNHDRAITAKGTFDITDAARVSPYADYLAVYLNRSYDDGRPDTRDQLGLFTTGVPPGTRTIERAEGLYTGNDLTAVLAAYAFPGVTNINAGANYVSTVKSLMSLAGITRTQIVPTDKVLAKPMTFAMGATQLEICNTLLEAIGYYHLTATPDGKLTSRPVIDIRYAEPVMTVTDDDLMGEIDAQPTDTSVANVIIVIQDNFNAPPLTATRRNEDANSPTSIQRIGYKARTETRSNLADQDAVDALADRLLAESRTWYQTATLRLLPTVGVLQPHSVIELDLTGRLAIFNGKWHIRTVKVGFTPDTAGPVLEINRITSAVEGYIV